MMVTIWFALLLGVVGALSGYLAGIVLSRIRATAAEASAEKIIESAHREADVIRKDASVQSRDVVLQARDDFEKQNTSKRKDLLTLEDRIGQRESNLDRKMAMLDKKESQIDGRLEEIEARKGRLIDRETALQGLENEKRLMLQKVASMTEAEARQNLLQEVEDELRQDAATLARHIQEEALESSERQARKIITNAIERYASDTVSEITTCTVPLPNDEMKGRIIGREGRNIRSLEAATGVNILIDDTPEVVVISGFDPMRREVARKALEKLISDGRIHPARIEEIVNKTQSEIDETIRQTGEDAIYELRIQHMAPEIIRTMGRLKYRHSYGQNVLKHSIEVGHIMGMMASELGLEPVLARRIGVLHDIGKAIDHSVEGGHAIIGADLLKKHDESQVVINAVAAHHSEVEPKSAYAVLIKAADAITAARPGARSETTEIYLRRLEKLEGIASSFRGVEKSYAIQAGREIRVIVVPSQIDDNEAMQMARNISKQVEHDLHYPGQIKVTVVRETRCVEYAR